MNFYEINEDTIAVIPIGYEKTKKSIGFFLQIVDKPLDFF